MNSSSEEHFLKSSQEESTEAVSVDDKESIIERMMRFGRTVGHFARLLGGLMLDQRVDRKAKIFVGCCPGLHHCATGFHSGIVRRAFWNVG